MRVALLEIIGRSRRAASSLFTGHAVRDVTSVSSSERPVYKHANLSSERILTQPDPPEGCTGCARVCGSGRALAPCFRLRAERGWLTRICHFAARVEHPTFPHCDLPERRLGPERRWLARVEHPGFPHFPFVYRACCNRATCKRLCIYIYIYIYIYGLVVAASTVPCFAMSCDAMLSYIDPSLDIYIVAFLWSISLIVISRWRCQGLDLEGITTNTTNTDNANADQHNSLK